MLVAKKTEPDELDLPEVEHIPLRDLQIDDIWRAKVATRMKELGINQHKLAAHVECAQGNISQLLSTKRSQARSLHAERISVALGIDLTILARAELAVISMLESNPELAATAVTAWEQTAAALPKKRR